MTDSNVLSALVAGQHRDPFAVLGPHRSGSCRVVRTLQPNAKSCALINKKGDVIAPMTRMHAGGIFEGELPARLRHYAFRVTADNGTQFDAEDPYRFPSTLGELDLYLLGEGSDQLVFRKLGAHVCKIGNVNGTRFAVWAPNASRVSVVGDFNFWDGRRHVMRLHPGNGIWEIFVPGAEHGANYKYEIQDRFGKLLPLKSDPYAAYHEAPPGNSSIVFQSRHQWRDDAWMQQRPATPQMDRPIAIYEVHPGSWRRGQHGSYLSYRDLADQLVDYVQENGFTHIELLPVSEHPFDGSWGYQPVGLFAPTHRFGTPDDFRYFIDRCHAAEISVIVDWVPAHFPKDEHGLVRFDGTALYEHADPRKGEHADWGTLIFNYGRREVVNYLIGSALYWVKELHIDAIRVDAVASMLYLDYSRKDGEWIPNVHGGNQNLEAVDFLKRFNTQIHAAGASTFAEESTAWPSVSRPVDVGGLGFTYKWNMGWMNDTLSYMAEDPVHRKYHHDRMTFGLVYAFNENFVLPLSHDEVVHGKRSIIGRMPGDEWQQFANLRAYYGFMYAHPGKKLLFMGSEIGQRHEWNHDQSLDWHLLQYPLHAGVQTLIRELNQLYRRTPALYEIDFDARGFEWLDWSDRDSSVLSWLRRDTAGNTIIAVTNLTPIVRDHYCIGVPAAGEYAEIFNTDSVRYGGSGVANDRLHTIARPYNGHANSLEVRLPALATLYLKPVNGA